MHFVFQTMLMKLLLLTPNCQLLLNRLLLMSSKLPFHVSDDADEAPAVDSDLPAAAEQTPIPAASGGPAPFPTPTLTPPTRTSTRTTTPTLTSPTPKTATATPTSKAADGGHPQATSTPRGGGGPRRRSQRNAQAAEASVIDLTMEEEGRKEVSTGGASSSASGDSPDVKPNVGELNRQMHQSEGEGVVTEESAGEGGASDLGSRVKEEEDTRLGHLRHKYKLLNQRFGNLQRNVHKLLSFIVPDVDLGNEDDIEHIVTEMIRVNCDQARKSSSS